MAYDFHAKRREGAKHEAVLDRLFSQWYTIDALDPYAPGISAERRDYCHRVQRMGIDRVFAKRPDAPGPRGRWAVEYKADSTAASTGNAFIETVSVDTKGTPGWAFHSLAQILVYYVPPTGLVLVVPVLSLRKAMAAWQATYPERAVPNDGYNTLGVLVPLAELEALSDARLSLPASGDGHATGLPSLTQPSETA